MTRTPQPVAAADTPAPVLVLLDVGLLREVGPDPVPPC